MVESTKDHENINTSLIELIQKENIFNQFIDYKEETKETTYKIEKILSQKSLQNMNLEFLCIQINQETNQKTSFMSALIYMVSVKLIIIDKTSITIFEYIINNQLHIFTLDPNDVVHIYIKWLCITD